MMARRRRDLSAPLREDTQFGVHLSVSNREGNREQKQSDDKENHSESDTCKPEVANGCIDCRKQRPENEGLKNKIENLERRLNLAWRSFKIMQEVVETKPAPGVLDASLAGEFKSARLPSKRGPSDNDQHLPVKQRKPSDPSSRNTSDLKHINESKHLEDTQFGVNLSGSNMEGKREQKQSNDKENHCLRDTCKPEVANDCINCRKQRLENGVLKNKIENLERRLNFAWRSCKIQEDIIKQAMKTGPEVIDAFLVRKSEMMKPVEESGSGCVNTASDISFGKEKFSSSSELGNEKDSMTADSHQRVNPPIVHTVSGTCVKRRREEGSPSCSIRRRLQFRPDHPPGTSDKDQCSTVDPKGKSVLHWSSETDGIGVMSEKSEGTIKIGIPEDELLEELARNIPNDWKTLGRRVNMTEAELDSIHKEEDQCRERAYKMLLKWKQAKGATATFTMLYNALCHHLVDRKDLAEKFCRDK